jgi:VWFA-related protein
LDAIYLAQQELLKREKENKSNRYAILLISDVEERNSYYSYDAVLKLFENSDAQIFILSYAENAPQEKKKAVSLGHKLALDTGGTIHNLASKHTKEDLIEVLKKLVFELRSNYVIGYTSTNSKHDGQSRKLTVEVGSGANGEKRNVLVRDGFTVPLKK